MKEFFFEKEILSYDPNNMTETETSVYLKVLDLLRSQQNEAAIDLCKTQNGKRFESLLASAYYQNHNYGKAGTLFSQLAEQYPQEPNFLLGQMQSQMARGWKNPAKKIADELLHSGFQSPAFFEQYILLVQEEPYSTQEEMLVQSAIAYYNQKDRHEENDVRVMLFLVTHTLKKIKNQSDSAFRSNLGESLTQLEHWMRETQWSHLFIHALFDIYALCSEPGDKPEDSNFCYERLKKYKYLMNPEQVSQLHRLPGREEVKEPIPHFSNTPANTRTYKREGRKIGRNELCPCGSGKKYKRCCGR